jgi:large subunit ribosomal protein L21
MATYAIIKTGGKQYRAEAGTQLTIEKIEANIGEEFLFQDVLLVAGEGDVRVGVPTVAGAVVRAMVIEQTRDNKVLIHHYRRRKNSRKTQGHRQWITRVRITAIEG